jgi:transglutaminase-like putative cysteine protease
VVVPPAQHGDQRRILHRLEVRGAPNRWKAAPDGFGNHRVDVRAAVVPEVIEFDAWVAVTRDLAGAHRVPGRMLDDRRLHEPSILTQPDRRLTAVARALGRGSGGALDVAERITGWVYEAMRYEFGVTNVRTTAAEALDRGEGVCQDYAHVMLALARLCGLAARYVSGHLVGEGGSHAWTEVVVADPRHPGSAEVVAFDPTHGRRAGLDYVTVAVGRDYADVAPTSGTFHASCTGRLTCRKRLVVSGR